MLSLQIVHIFHATATFLKIATHPDSWTNFCTQQTPYDEHFGRSAPPFFYPIQRSVSFGTDPLPVHYSFFETAFLLKPVPGPRKPMCIL